MDLTNKSDIGDLRTRIQNSIAALANDLDLRITVGNCRFEGSGDGLTFKLEVERDDALPKFERDLRERFISHAGLNLLCGLSELHLGSTFKSGSNTFRLIGLKRRVRIQPIVARQQGDGRLYRFEIGDVAQAFGISQKITAVEAMSRSKAAFDRDERSR